MSKQQQIIDTALRLFVERGIQGTSMSLLAKEAGVAAGSIYNYFSSKEDLINQLFIYAKSLEVEHIKKHYDKDQSIEARFRTIYGASIRHMIENRLPFKFFENYCFSPIITEEIRQELKETFSILIEFYEDAQKMDYLKPYDPFELHLQIYGGIGRMVHWKIFHNQTISESEENQMLNIAWDALIAHPESSASKEV